jgi:hypothetical protein
MNKRVASPAQSDQVVLGIISTLTAKFLVMNFQV